MDWLQILQVIANIAQIFGVIWLLVFGGNATIKVIGDFLKGRQPIRMPTASTITNVLLALILLALLSSRFFPMPSSRPTPTTTPSTPGTGGMTPSPSSKTPAPVSVIPSPSSTAVPSLTPLPCGNTINSPSPDVGGPPYTISHITIKTGCVGIIESYKGNVDNGQQQWNQDGGLVALPAGDHDIIFTDGVIIFSPAPTANATFCKLKHEDPNIKYVRPLSDWQKC